MAAPSDEDRDWHAMDAGAVLDALDTDADGLSTAEAERRFAVHGSNELQEGESVSALRVFLSQFRNTLVYLLVVAAVLSVAVGFLPGQEPEYADAALILLILLGNGVFGFVQDYRAARAMEALRALSTPDALVLRDGQPRTVDARELVPGDVVVLEQGDVVPADARLLEATDLATDEAALTGESEPVDKSTAPVDAAAQPADRTDLAFMNTTAVRGRGRAVVAGTGMETEVGVSRPGSSSPRTALLPSRRRSRRSGGASGRASSRSSCWWRPSSLCSPRPRRSRSFLEDGRALAKFREIVAAQGGAPDVESDDLQPGEERTVVTADRGGVVTNIDNELVSEVARRAGAPRDHAAGIHLERILDDEVVEEDALYTIYAEQADKLADASALADRTEIVRVRGPAEMLVERA